MWECLRSCILIRFTPEHSDELQPGVREVVRCYIAQKRKISVGDKKMCIRDSVWSASSVSV